MHGLTKEQLEIRQVETLDIASDTTDYWSYIVGPSNFDFSQFQSARTGRGPLLEGWQVGISSSFLQSLLYAFGTANLLLVIVIQGRNAD